MSTLNKIMLIGRLTNDPELLQKNDYFIAKFRLAVSRYSKKSGETDFFNVSYFGKSAEFIQQYVKKGDQVYVEGSIHIQATKKPDSSYSTFISVTGDRVELLLKKASATNNDNVGTDDLSYEEEPIAAEGRQGQYVSQQSGYTQQQPAYAKQQPMYPQQRQVAYSKQPAQQQSVPYAPSTPQRVPPKTFSSDVPF